MSEENGLQPKDRQRRYSPVIGEDFEASISLVEAKKKSRTSLTRDLIAATATITVVVSLMIGALSDWGAESYDALKSVWAISAPFVGYIFATYMKSGNPRKDDG